MCRKTRGWSPWSFLLPKVLVHDLKYIEGRGDTLLLFILFSLTCYEVLFIFDVLRASLAYKLRIEVLFTLVVLRVSWSFSSSSPTIASWNFTRNFSQNISQKSRINRKRRKPTTTLAPARTTPTRRPTSFRRLTTSRWTKTTFGLFWRQNSCDRKVGAERSRPKVTAAATRNSPSLPLLEVAKAGAAVLVDVVGFKIPDLSIWCFGILTRISTVVKTKPKWGAENVLVDSGSFRLKITLTTGLSLMFRCYFWTNVVPKFVREWYGCLSISLALCTA